MVKAKAKVTKSVEGVKKVMGEVATVSRLRPRPYSRDAKVTEAKTPKMKLKRLRTNRQTDGVDPGPETQSRENGIVKNKATMPKVNETGTISEAPVEMAEDVNGNAKPGDGLPKEVQKMKNIVGTLIQRTGNDLEGDKALAVPHSSSNSRSQKLEQNCSDTTCHTYNYLDREEILKELRGKDVIIKSLTEKIQQLEDEKLAILRSTRNSCGYDIYEDSGCDDEQFNTNWNPLSTSADSRINLNLIQGIEVTIADAHPDPLIKGEVGVIMNVDEGPTCDVHFIEGNYAVSIEKDLIIPKIPVPGDEVQILKGKGGIGTLKGIDNDGNGVVTFSDRVFPLSLLGKSRRDVVDEVNINRNQEIINMSMNDIMSMNIFEDDEQSVPDGKCSNVN